MAQLGGIKKMARLSIIMRTLIFCRHGVSCSSSTNSLLCGRGDDRPRSSVVERWTRYSKVAGWDPACGKLSFRPFFFLHNYITIPSNHNPYTFPGIIFC